MGAAIMVSITPPGKEGQMGGSGMLAEPGRGQRERRRMAEEVWCKVRENGQGVFVSCAVERRNSRE